MTLNFLLNGFALITSITALYLTTCREEAWLRRGGSLIGIISCIFNIYLLRDGPTAPLILSIVAFGIYWRSAGVFGLIKKVLESKNII